MNDGFRQMKPSTLLAPVPAVIVSCNQANKNVPNLITIAWSGTICSDPPMLSISVRPQRFSHALLIEEGEFVVNLVDRKLLRAADYCGVRSGRDVDKLQECQLTARRAAGLKRAWALAESPLTLSCRISETMTLGSHDLFLAQVEAVEARESLFDEKGRLALERADLIAFAHGQYQALGPVLGFFGYSIASPQAYRRRMAPFKKSPSNRKKSKPRNPKRRN